MISTNDEAKAPKRGLEESLDIESLSLINEDN